MGGFGFLILLLLFFLLVISPIPEGPYTGGQSLFWHLTDN